MLWKQTKPTTQSFQLLSLTKLYQKLETVDSITPYLDFLIFFQFPSGNQRVDQRKLNQVTLLILCGRE